MRLEHWAFGAVLALGITILLLTLVALLLALALAVMWLLKAMGGVMA